MPVHVSDSIKFAAPALCLLLAGAAPFLLGSAARADEPSLESAPPVVVKTVPPAGATDVDPSLTQIRVTFSKPMEDGSWSWSTWGEDTFPELIGKPHYLPDGRTCVIYVKLQPDKFYASWLNSERFHNFKDRSGKSAVPYLLTFVTGQPGKSGTSGMRSASRPKRSAKAGSDVFAAADAKLDDAQRGMLGWTDTQFDEFFDDHDFKAMPEAERNEAEAKALEALNGVHTGDYYSAICTLGALQSKKAVEPLLAIATDRAEKDNRDRWMAVRALGMIGDKQVVPSLIPLLYHLNANTRWWAQISLVRLTGQNFGKDWQAWGKWWDSQGGQPPFNPEIVRWYKDQAPPEKLSESLAPMDHDWLQGIGVKTPEGQKPAESPAPAPAKQ